jgi:iron complex transport system permease protein
MGGHTMTRPITILSVWIIAGIAIALSLLASISIGPADISPQEALAALLSPGQWQGQGQSPNQNDADIIIRHIRLPRALAALIVGAGLGASGAALQGFTRNDLAAPGLLGFSACAAFGAVIALYFGLGWAVMPGALAGAMIGAIAITLMARRQVGAGGLILAGIGIGALATALTGLAMNLAPNPWALSELTYWLMGSLEGADWPKLGVATGLTLLGLIALSICGRALGALSLGEDVAASLGISVLRIQSLLIAGTALCIGAGVALAGAIGFVGLFVPHIVRRLPQRLGGTTDPAALIGRSALGGAWFLLITDTVVRAVSGPGTPLYLGIVTSLIGVPFFLYLALRKIAA